MFIRTFRQTSSRALRRNGHCRRCSTNTNTEPQTPQASGSTRLTNRRLISIHGHDAPQFLQGLTTNNVTTGNTEGFYSAFLTAQGRVLNDVFIYPTHHSISYITNLSSTLDHNDPGYFVEVDADEASKLYTHLRRYKLRSKLAIRLLDDEEWSIWSTWGDHANRPKANTERGENEDDVEDAPPSDDIGCLDPRAPLMGRRVVLSSFSSPPDSSTQQPLSAYHIRRTLLGVAEGQREILPETALPLESNMDYMKGIDFRKGCYVGQELTIRTRHTGVVRKRILPVRLYPADETSRPPSRLEHDDTVLHTGQIEMPTPGTNVVRMDGGDGRKRNVGRWLDGVGNIGFALCRLDPMKKMMSQPEDDQSWAADGEFGAEWVRDGETYLGGKVKMRAFWPDWFPDIGG